MAAKTQEAKRAAAREYSKRYYQENREKILRRAKAYIKEKYHSDEEFRERMKSAARKSAEKAKATDPDLFFEKRRQQCRRWAENNPEKNRESRRKSAAKRKLLNPEAVNKISREAGRRYYERNKHDERWRTKSNVRSDLRKQIGATAPEDLLTAEIERRMVMREIRKQLK